MKLSADFDKLQDDLVLDEQQRALLVSYVRTEGFQLILRMWRDEVRKFNVKAMNSDLADEKKALANLFSAKIAAQIYQGWVNRLNEELQLAEAQVSTVGTIENPENNISIEEVA